MKQATGTETGSRSLWLSVSAGFVLLVLSWTVLFSIARSAKVETVPLAAPGGRP